MSEETSSQADTSSEAAATETTEATTVDSNGEAQTTTSYMDGKYDSVSALESGYKELQSTFSKKTAEYNTAMGGQTGAPEVYELGEGANVSEGMQQYARENNFSNDALSNLAEAYRSDQEATRNAHIAEQRDLLGKDADVRLNNLQDWAKANGGDEGVFNGMITSAASVEFMENLMKISQGTSQAAAPAPQAVDRDTLDSMRFATDQYGNRRMSSDPAYRAKVEALEAQSFTKR